MSSEKPDGKESVLIQLDPNEALVLFELLSRWSDKQEGCPDSSCFQANAECGVLLNILGCLETKLSAPFRSDYAKVLADAREALADSWPTTSLHFD